MFLLKGHFYINSITSYISKESTVKIWSLRNGSPGVNQRPEVTEVRSDVEKNGVRGKLTMTGWYVLIRRALLY